MLFYAIGHNKSTTRIKNSVKFHIIIAKNKGYHKLLYGDIMIINYTENELDLLARLMRAEALSEGDLGMLMYENRCLSVAID